MKREEFPARIKAIRRALGMSQEEFGKLVGVSRQQVIRWESGAQRATQGRIENICGLLGITQKEFWDPNFSFTPDHIKGIAEGERLKPGPYLGTPVDETGRALACPRCGDTSFTDTANYCRICGMSLRNACIGPQHHPNLPDARYCETCGQPTSWSMRDDEVADDEDM